MRVFYGFDALPEFERAVVTIGSFDGVHAGHQSLLRVTIDESAKIKGQSVVVTFAPHPRLVLEEESTLQLLSTDEEKFALLEKIGVENVVVVPFTRQFSQLGSSEFIQKCLVERLHLHTLVVGYNHHFGRDRGNNFTSAATTYGFNIRHIAKFGDEEDKISSTTIRKLLLCGDVENATRMLNHPYLIIASADKQGKISISDDHKLLPPAGSYRCLVDGEQGIIELSADSNILLNKLLHDNQNVNIELI